MRLHLDKLERERSAEMAGARPRTGSPPLRRRPLSGCVTGACEIMWRNGAPPKLGHDYCHSLLILDPVPEPEAWCPKPTPREPEESEPMKRPDRTELLVMAAMAAVAILLV